MSLEAVSDNQSNEGRSVLSLLTHDVLSQLKKNEMEALSKEIRKAYIDKYRKSHSKEPKYGTLPRWFRDEQLLEFFNAIDETNQIEMRLKVLWLLQAYGGLRPGEIIQLSTNPEHAFYFDERHYAIRIPALKGGKLSSILLEGECKFLMADYLETFRECIKAANGYVFFSKNPYSYKKHNGHLSVHYVRKVFNDIRKRCPGIQNSYGRATCYHPEGKPRILYNITWHSLRHYCGKKAMLKFKDLTLVRDLLRHQSIETSQIYCKNTDEEINEARAKLWG